MFPAKYGYKSAKAVTAVASTEEDGTGYLVNGRPLHRPRYGDIRPDGDLPQDFPGERKQIEGGEITANGNPADTHRCHLRKCQGKQQVEFHRHLRVQSIAATQGLVCHMGLNRSNRL
jgi:hypothetical protein